MKKLVEAIVNFKVLTSPPNQLLLFAILSLLAVLTQGVDTKSHFMYNLSALQLLQNDVTYGISIALNSGSLEYYYLVNIVPWLKLGTVVFIMAVIVRFIAYCLVYQICLKCIEEEKTAIVATLLFMIPVGASAHGIVGNGLWAAPALFPATLSALFTLTGLLLFLRTGEFSGFHISSEEKRTTPISWVLEHKGTRYVLAGVAFALSIQFHGLYGATAFAWLFISTLMILASRGWRDWTWFFVEFIIVVSAIAYVAYLSFENNALVSTHATVGEWYRFIKSVDYDDVSLFCSLEYGGYAFLPLIFSGTYFAFKTKEKTDIERLSIGMFYSLLIFTAIEVFHYNGLFFGKVSEYFIAAQLRRGIWIVALTSLIVLAKNYRTVLNSIHEKHRMLLVALGVTTFAAPAVVTVIIFLAVVMYTHPKKQFICFLLVVATGTSLAHIFHGYLNIAIEVKSVILLVSAVFTLCILRCINREPILSMVISSVFVVILLAWLCAGLFKGAFLTSFDTLASIEKNEITQFAKHYDPKAISCIKENTVDSDVNGMPQKIQPPPFGVNFYTESRYTQKFFFSGASARAWLSSKDQYEKSLEKIMLLVGKSAYNRIFYSKESFSKEILHDRFAEEYNAISIKQLKVTHDKAGLRFYLVENKRDELSQAFLCVGDLYHVYDLTKL
jgi:hypothetical protein